MAIALEDIIPLPELQLETGRRGERRRGLGDLLGGSPAMQTMYELIERLSETDVPVLIQGETGTGKGLVARTLHRQSRRRKGPFLHQNCGALPRELMESELFGHARGAFTGASADRQGVFEGASGATHHIAAASRVDAAETYPRKEKSMVVGHSASGYAPMAAKRKIKKMMTIGSW